MFTHVVLSKTKVDLKNLFFEFVKQSFGLWGFKMVTRLRKRTETRREVIKKFLNVEKNEGKPVQTTSEGKCLST